MTTPVNCPACGQSLTAVVTLAPVPDPGAPVPQPIPAPAPPPSDSDVVSSDLAPRVYREQGGQWQPAEVPGDPSQIQVGPNVYAARGPFGPSHEPDSGPIDSPTSG